MRNALAAAPGPGWAQGSKVKVHAPGMVEAIKVSLMAPRVLGRMETDLARRVGLHFTEEGEGAVQVRVPCDRPECCSGCRCQRGVRVQRVRLHPMWHRRFNKPKKKGKVEESGLVRRAL